MSEELKPCPFCADRQFGKMDMTFLHATGPTKGVRIKCQTCGAQAPDTIWNHRAQPAETEGVDRQRMIESMCLTWRHDFGLDKPADCQLSSGMTDTERHQLRGQIGRLFDHHFAPALAAVTAEVEGLRKERGRFRAEVKSLLDTITAMAEERDRIRVEVEALRSVAREFAGFFSSDEPRHWEFHALADAAAMAAKESTHEE